MSVARRFRDEFAKEAQDATGSIVPTGNDGQEGISADVRPGRYGRGKYEVKFTAVCRCKPQKRFTAVRKLEEAI